MNWLRDHFEQPLTPEQIICTVAGFVLGLAVAALWAAIRDRIALHRYERALRQGRILEARRP